MAGENLGDEGRERKTGQEIIGDVDIACGVRGKLWASVFELEGVE